MDLFYFITYKSHYVFLTHTATHYANRVTVYSVPYRVNISYGIDVTRLYSEHKSYLAVF